MQQEFISLTLPKRELADFHRGLLMRHVAENLVRREQGLEEGDYPETLAKLEEVLGISEERAHALFHEVEDELWSYAWYVYTEEWAWHRAKTETTKELGAKAEEMKSEELDSLIEQNYEKHFESYVAEIDMKEEKSKSTGRKTDKEQKKK